MTRRRRVPAEPGGDPAAPLRRTERKLRTRTRLLEAALHIMARGRSFTSLGLREITREAGVVPTSFYRHFTDLDELGLALVEEGGITLRRLLREARREGVPPAHMLRSSVRIYLDFVKQHRLRFAFIAGERLGGSPVIRRAIRHEVTHFSNEMAQDLLQLKLLPGLSTDALQMICGLVVNTMLSAAGDILDLPDDAPEQEIELTETFVRQMRLIFLGAARWQERPAAGR
jgi:TetR/AcrR family transcriptional regulator, fatty acid biosynthesis regulator